MPCVFCMNLRQTHLFPIFFARVMMLSDADEIPRQRRNIMQPTETIHSSKLTSRRSSAALSLAATVATLIACTDLGSANDDDDALGNRPDAEDFAPAFIDLPGDDLFPEGIIAAPNGDLYVTGFGNGAIVRIEFDDDGDNHDGQNEEDDDDDDDSDAQEAPSVEAVELFRAPGEDSLSSAVGMAIDEVRNRLWVANFSFATLTSNLKVFDLDSGDLLATVEPNGGPENQFFNELAIDGDGRVYISDTLNPAVWTAASNLEFAEVLVSDPLLANPDPVRPFGLNGIALTENGQYLIASVMDRIDQGDGRLVRIEIDTRQVSDVVLSGALDIFGGSDGMLFDDRDSLVMVNVTPPASIVTAEFNDDFSAAQLLARDAFEEVFDRPTAPAIRQDWLFVVNSQLDHIIDDENGALNTPHQVPFQITAVPTRDLLR